MRFLYDEFNIKPIVKWVGGKRQLIADMQQYFPQGYSIYAEMFAGGLAVLFSLCPERAIVNDINSELINLYRVVKTNVKELIDCVHTFQNTEDDYYEVRGWDRCDNFAESYSATERAARILYLNKTCFNGVYRVNKKGYFNVPFGRYKTINFDEQNLLAVSRYFNTADITFASCDYTELAERIPDAAFVYMDPPYDPVSSTADFTTYTKYGFARDDQAALKNICDELTGRNVLFMQSNSDTEYIRSLYADYDINIIQAKRVINRNGNGRGAVNELIIRNYR